MDQGCASSCNRWQCELKALGVAGTRIALTILFKPLRSDCAVPGVSSARSSPPHSKVPAAPFGQQEAHHTSALDDSGLASTSDTLQTNVWRSPPGPNTLCLPHQQSGWMGQPALRSVAAPPVSRMFRNKVLAGNADASHVAANAKTSYPNQQQCLSSSQDYVHWEEPRVSGNGLPARGPPVQNFASYHSNCHQQSAPLGHSTDFLYQNTFGTYPNVPIPFHIVQLPLNGFTSSKAVEESKHQELGSLGALVPTVPNPAALPLNGNYLNQTQLYPASSSRHPASSSRWQSVQLAKPHFPSHTFNDSSQSMSGSVSTTRKDQEEGRWHGSKSAQQGI